jgi:hypothetical protein
VSPHVTCPETVPACCAINGIAQTIAASTHPHAP